MAEIRPLTLRRRNDTDDWHFVPACPRWPKDEVPALQELRAGELKPGGASGAVCQACVKLGGYHRGRGSRWH